MTATYDEQEIKDGPLTILQLMARRIQNNGDNKILVRDMMAETELSRGSVHNYLTGTLRPLGLVDTTGTKPTPGAAEDAKYWGLTQSGYDWVTSLGPDELAPVEASGQAFETAKKARDIAVDARSTADSTNDQLTDLRDEFEVHIDNLESDLSSLDSATDELRTKLDRESSNRDEEYEEVRGKLADLDKDIGNLQGETRELREYMLGDTGDNGKTGLDESVRSNTQSIEDTVIRVGDNEKRVVIVGAFTVVAIILALLGIII